MNRDRGLAALESRDRIWDVLVVGGGATGLGTALDAASRGLKTLLVERGDFASGTSSRSTKLIHGGVRYLKQGNVRLVREGLRERGLLFKNAPDWVKPLPFVIPVRGPLEWAFYRCGLGLYDFLGGAQNVESTRTVGPLEMSKCFPKLGDDFGKRGVRYLDGQFDDAHFAIRLAQQASLLGATILNYVELKSLGYTQTKMALVSVEDVETGRVYELEARVVINATGVFSDQLRQKVEPQAGAQLRFSQGAHLVLDRDYLGGDAALMIPRTEDGRVLFAIPWHGRTLFGTTDVPVVRAEVRPRPMQTEIDYLLKYARRVFGCTIEKAEVRSCFAGIRPLLDSVGKTGHATASLSRDHRIEVSGSGLVTIAGGKWTSYRRMAEEVMDCAIQVGGLRAQKSGTASMRLNLEEVVEEGADQERMVEGLPWVWGDVKRACRLEMARTVDDILARRTRLLFTDVVEAVRLAPRVAQIMAEERGLGGDWVKLQVDKFREVAADFQPL